MNKLQILRIADWSDGVFVVGGILKNSSAFCLSFFSFFKEPRNNFTEGKLEILKMSDKHKDAKEIPDVISNPQTKKRYLKGKFLGKGGFARCYELTDMDSKQIYAGKIVSKTLLTKKHQKDKVGLRHRELFLLDH